MESSADETLKKKYNERLQRAKTHNGTSKNSYDAHAWIDKEQPGPILKSDRIQNHISDKSGEDNKLLRVVKKTTQSKDDSVKIDVDKLSQKECICPPKDPNIRNATNIIERMFVGIGNMIGVNVKFKKGV